MLLAAAALAAQPIEAGFPCRTAATAQERLVCARPELAAADVELNRRYREALVKLGPDGRRQLRTSHLVQRPAAFRSTAYRRLTAAYAGLDFSGFRHVPDVALHSESWEPTAAGLVVHYGTIFGRPSGDMAATLPWREMAPFLSARGRRIAASFTGMRPAGPD